MRANTTVTSVRTDRGGYLVQTDQGLWHARRLCSPRAQAPFPRCLRCRAVPAGITTIPRPTTATRASFPTAGSSSSAPRRAGSRLPRKCTAPAGRSRSPSGNTSECRAPIEARTSCGGWTRPGVLDERYDQIPDLVRARNLPSMQLVGSPERTTLDLNSLSQLGVQLVGRLAGIRDGDRAILRLVAEHVRAGRPQARTAARHHRRVGDRTRAWTAAIRRDGSQATAVSAHAAADPRPALRRRSERFCGPPDSARTCPGSTFRSSTERAMSATTAASPRAPACTSWGCRSCAAASRP